MCRSTQNVHKKRITIFRWLFDILYYLHLFPKHLFLKCYHFTISFFFFLWTRNSASAKNWSILPRFYLLSFKVRLFPNTSFMFLKPFIEGWFNCWDLVFNGKGRKILPSRLKYFKLHYAGLIFNEALEAEKQEMPFNSILLVKELTW